MAMMANGMAAMPPQAANDGESQVFTLFVNNVPSELEKEGVESIFIQYGEIVGIQVAKNRNGTCAYVSFASYKDAEKAVHELHRKPPLMLNIQFKDKRLQAELNKTNDMIVTNLASPINDFRYKYNPVNDTKHLVKSIDLGKPNCRPVFESNNYTSDDDLLYPVPCDPSMFNPYEVPGPYATSNLMYTRGTVHYSRDGRRHVSCGRGYTFYKLPEPNYNTAEMLHNVCEKRERGYYIYASDDSEDDTGLCKICTTPTSYRCQKCSITFYCCRQCQVGDWPKHKLECQPIPPLVKMHPNKVPLQKHNGHTELSSSEAEVQKPMPLRRPREEIQHQQLQHQKVQEEQKQLQTNSKENINNEREKQKGHKSPMQSKSPPKPPKNNQNHQIIKENKNDSCKLQNQATNFKAEATSFPTKQQSLQQQQRRESQNQNSTSKIQSNMSDDNIVFQPKSFFDRDTFTTVLVTSTIVPGEYWVQKVNETEKIEKFLYEVQAYAKVLNQRLPPKENVRCLVEFEDLWYRATIISIGDPISKVFLHDFGIYVDVSTVEVCPIDGELKEKPSFAHHIRIIEEADPGFMKLETGDELNVKALHVEGDGTIIVQVSGKPETANKEITKTEVVTEVKKSTINEDGQKPPPIQTIDKLAYDKLKNMSSILDSLKTGQTGIILLGAELSQGEYSTSLVPDHAMNDFTSLLEDLKTDCTALLKENPNYSPKVGDLVSGLCDAEEWYRGVIIEDKPIIKMAVIDESRITLPIKCIPLPVKYQNIPVLGLSCQLESKSGLPTPKPEACNFTVLEVSKTLGESSAVITVTTEDDTYSDKAVVKKWIPRPEQKGIQQAKLNSGDEVIIMDFSSQNLLYLRSRVAAESDRANRLEQEVAKCALNRKPLTKMPVVGQMVLSHYLIDDNYYRAIVKRIENEKILIIYIDYGNGETVALDKLYDLSEELKQEPSCVRMVKLKNVDSNLPLTEEATSYVQELIGGPMPLICTFNGDPFEDGVELKTLKKENVNERLNLLLKPTWETDNPNKDKNVYTLRDLPPLKLGDVGDDVEAVTIAHMMEAENSICLGLNDAVVVEAIQVTMAENIQKYVATTTSHYIPREAELCIAKYDDQYYRALCLEPSASPTESLVFFIDYGNKEVVNHKDIRVITKDFLEIGAYGILCSLNHIVSEDKLNDKIQQRVQEILPVHDFVNLKIIGIDNDGAPIIDIPLLRVKLIEENLI